MMYFNRSTVRWAALALLASTASIAVAQTTQPQLTPASAEAFQQSLREAKPGQTVLTDLASLNEIESIPLTLTRADDSPQYVLSDRPEYFRSGDGIAMQEQVKPGTVRLYIYHVPEPSGAKKVIPAVIRNDGDAPLTLKMLRIGAPAPSGDYHKLAKQAMASYFQSPGDSGEMIQFTLQPGERRAIDEKLSSSVVTKDILVHGIYEFTIDQPATITTFQKDPDAPIDVMDKLPKLPRVLPGFNASGAGRGLFVRSNVDVVIADGGAYDTASGVKKVIVADGKSDPWLEGRDSIDTSTPVMNKGNYGVMYRMKLKVKSTDGRDVALVMSINRTDSQWCKVAGAVVKVSDGRNPGGVVPLPADSPRFRAIPEACVIQTFAMEKGEEREIELTYSPPGACCLPTPILLVPISE
jgi:hypothetical protein